MQGGGELRKLSPNGTITNDKFCLSRHVRLHLSHWRLAQRSQQTMSARSYLIKAQDTYCCCDLLRVNRAKRGEDVRFFLNIGRVSLDVM
jgi:hypothetical protein